MSAVMQCESAERGARMLVTGVRHFIDVLRSVYASFSNRVQVIELEWGIGECNAD